LSRSLGDTKPQSGNPRPRAVRGSTRQACDQSHGLFNNDGADAVLRRLAARAHHGASSAFNVGANKDTAIASPICETDRDLRAGGELFHRNGSSPNTPGLRNLHRRRRSTTSWPR